MGRLMPLLVHLLPWWIAVLYRLALFQEALGEIVRCLCLTEAFGLMAGFLPLVFIITDQSTVSGWYFWALYFDGIPESVG